jgi:hypothetical protein
MIASSCKAMSACMFPFAECIGNACRLLLSAEVRAEVSEAALEPTRRDTSVLL